LNEELKLHKHDYLVVVDAIYISVTVVTALVCYTAIDQSLFDIKIEELLGKIIVVERWVLLAAINEDPVIDPCQRGVKNVYYYE
jgi:hypothetical protein